MEKSKTLRSLVLLGPIWYLIAVAYIFISRSAYPFELEFMEGGTLLHILRLENNLPLYVKPSLEYAPFIYPPLYYYVAYAVSKITGLGWFLPLRLTSILATAGITLLIFVIVFRHTKSLYWATLACGIFLATFQAAGAWFDIARVDMLFVLFLLLTVFILTSFENFWASFFAGTFLGLAFYTKQTAIAYGIFFIAGLFLMRGWRTAATTGLLFFLVSGISFGFEHYISDGWYGYYVFMLPSNHSLYSPLWLALIVHGYNIFFKLSVVSLVGLRGIYLERKTLSHHIKFLLICILGLITLAGASSLNSGAYSNNYLPAFAGLALLFGVCGFWIEKRLSSSAYNANLVLLYAACFFQFGLLFYNINLQIPTQEDRMAGESLVATIHKIDGGVFMPYSVYIPIMADKSASIHIVTLLEIEGHFGHTQDSHWKTLTEQFKDSVQNKVFSAIVLNHEYDLWEILPNNYEMTILEYRSEKTFVPVTGTSTRPINFWIPLP